MDEKFEGYKVMAHCRGGDEYVHMAHNARLWSVILSEDHIDPTKYHEVLVNLGTVKNAYKFLFDDARKDYNKKVRKCKRIDDYHELVRNDLRRGKHKNQNADGSRKDAYEMILQIGNRDEHPDDELCAKILKRFTIEWVPSHYPNAFIIQNTIHGDEFSLDKDGNKIPSPVHSHLDLVFIAHALTPEEIEKEREYRAKMKESLKKQLTERGEEWDEKKWQKKDWQKELVQRYGKSLMSGMSLQASMTAALAEMGFFTQKGKGTAQQQWEEQVRRDLQDFAEREFGLKIDRSLGKKHSHMQKEQYQLKKDNEKKSAELSEKENSLNSRESQIVLKESSLQQRESNIAENESAQTKKEAKLLEDSRNLALLKNDIEYREKKIEEHKEFVDSYEAIIRQGRKKIFSLEDAEKKFYADSEKIPIKKRITTFIQNCKNVVVDVIMELEKYKRAFKGFWKGTPAFFRKLADNMEANNCSEFSAYEQKREAGQLASQLASSKKNHNAYETRKNAILQRPR